VQFLANQAFATALMAAALTAVGISAQASGQVHSGHAMGTITPSNGAVELTGKERLSAKWKDEQRIDDCKGPTRQTGAQGTAR